MRPGCEPNHSKPSLATSSSNSSATWAASPRAQCADPAPSSLSPSQAAARLSSCARVTLSSRRGVTPGAARPARALVMAAEETVAVPLGMKRYETMFLMLPDASEDELAKEVRRES